MTITKNITSKPNPMKKGKELSSIVLMSVFIYLMLSIVNIQTIEYLGCINMWIVRTEWMKNKVKGQNI